MARPYIRRKLTAAEKRVEARKVRARQLKRIAAMSETKRRQVIEAVRGGWTYKSTALWLGLSPQLVRFLCKEMKVEEWRE